MSLRPITLALLLAAAPAAAAAPADPPPDAARRQALVELVRQDCGSCHGYTLKGGLGPSLQTGAMAPRDPAELARVILDGRKGTPMPPWRGLLTGGEVRWIVRELQKGFPE